MLILTPSAPATFLLHRLTRYSSRKRGVGLQALCAVLCGHLVRTYSFVELITTPIHGNELNHRGNPMRCALIINIGRRRPREESRVVVVRFISSRGCRLAGTVGIQRRFEVQLTDERRRDSNADSLEESKNEVISCYHQSRKIPLRSAITASISCRTEAGHKYPHCSLPDHHVI